MLRLIHSPVFSKVTRCLTVTASLILLNACSVQPKFNPDAARYHLVQAPKCRLPDVDGKQIFPIFDQTTDHLKGTGWSHIPNPAKPVFAGLSRSPRDPLYNIPQLGPVANDQCGGQRLYQGILVKKYGDYDNQHANGLEPKLQGATFGQVEKLILELRIDSQNTRIPPKKAFQQSFGRWLNDAQLEQIDNQKVNFRVTLFGDNAPAPAEGYALAAEIFVTLEPAHTDRWYRLEIPLASMHAYKGLSYKQISQTLADHQATPLAGVQINPETRGNDPVFYGKVARNFMKDTWGKPEVPKELFKEYGVSIRYMALQLKP